MKLIVPSTYRDAVAMLKLDIQTWVAYMATELWNANADADADELSKAVAAKVRQDCYKLGIDKSAVSRGLKSVGIVTRKRRSGGGGGGGATLIIGKIDSDHLSSIVAQLKKLDADSLKLLAKAVREARA